MKLILLLALVVAGSGKPARVDQGLGHGGYSSLYFICTVM